MLDTKDLLKNLRLLEEEHRDLDEVIYELQQNKTINLMQIIRLKKKKLYLKDKIKKLKYELEPDIIA
ncbi:MAG: hypothetical protein CFH22_00757 [Alphaproteobacteria bacterium MarineAlpha5_Bin12]|nr:hypothetical protein [Pelagibacteraceae bacterium]PPR41343.1 MAG: hypothetical protein CFH22_00757 [Alphaproteobacteria bacterium MarineAlpha5_Bin12]|tara:strand:- start:7177 stop:7377 length:201 start_codon:yes stop_codon:yes gene_type:complete